MADLIARAKAGAIHDALGFDSWTSYLADALAPLCIGISREKWREIVALLVDAGMSIRAIAAATDTPKSTVADVVRQMSETRTPDAEPAMVTGLDGKHYQREGRKGRVAQRRSPTFDELVRNLAKRVKRIEKLANADSYVIGRENFDYLMEARDVIDFLISQIRG